MIIGVPKEIMTHEGRVALTPKGVRALTEAGHKVIIESQAGKESAFSDEDFLKAGALVKTEPQSVYWTDLVVKVKEPQEEEYQYLKGPTESGCPGMIFAFLHLPANPKLVRILQEKNITAIAYEGIQLENGQRPILQPMSEIAGKRAIEEGMRYLKKNPKNTKVLILGAAGVVGNSAVKTALSFGASVIALDLPGKLPSLESNNYIVKLSTPENIQKAIKEVDLVVGAIATPGGKTEKLVSRRILSSMRPSSVIADVAIDEGGCVETSKPTTHDKPIFIEEGVIHYCVKNIPGAVPKISTPALTSATLPYILEMANKGLEKAIKENPALAKGVQIYKGKIANQKLAETFGEEYTPLAMLLQ